MAGDEDIAQLDAAQNSRDLISVVGLVQSLQSDNSLLRKESQHLQNQMAMLRADALARDTGTRFPRFSSLPAEIRRLIWIHACKVPQVQIIACQRISSSVLNDIYDSCEEAKQVILSLRLLSFQSTEQMGRLNFFNTHLDTLYIKNDRISEETVEWLCGLCHPSHVSNGAPARLCEHKYGVLPNERKSFDSLQGPTVNPIFNTPKIIHRLATPYEDLRSLVWSLRISGCALYGPHYGVPICKLVNRYQVKELLIVLQTIKIRGTPERGVSFIEPSQSPTEWYTNLNEAGNHRFDHDFLLWHLRNLICEFHDQHWSIYESKLLELLEDIGKAILDNWVTPKVKFVVAMMSEDLAID